MRPELTFWDQITLSLVLVFVVIYIFLKLKQLFSASSGGCGGCSSASTCGAPLTKKRQENKVDVHMVCVSSLQQKHCAKNKSKTQGS